MNLELTYFKAMFNELIRLVELYINLIERVSSFKKDEQEMVYLVKDQIKGLLYSCKQHTTRYLTISGNIICTYC